MMTYTFYYRGLYRHVQACTVDAALTRLTEAFGSDVRDNATLTEGRLAA